MLGYYAFTEDTVDGGNRAMDLSWWDNFDGESWNDLVLHLERENYYYKDEETLDKLFCDRESVPRNVIGIISVPNKDRMDELLTIATRMCKIENALLIFRTNATDKNQDYFDEVHAYLLKNNDIITSKTAYITEVCETLFMHFERELSGVK